MIEEATRATGSSQAAATPSSSTPGDDQPQPHAADVREMLIQHILTEEIFAHVFDVPFPPREQRRAGALRAGGDVLHRRREEADAQGVGTLLRCHPRRGRADRQPPREADLPQGHLRGLLQGLQPEALADRLGVVYTPNEVVRFMVESADWLCRTLRQAPDRPGRRDSLDPATGYGHVRPELLEHFRGQPRQASPTSTSTNCTRTRSLYSRTTSPT